MNLLWRVCAVHEVGVVLPVNIWMDLYEHVTVRIGHVCSSVVFLMWCTSVCYLVEFDWSVNEFSLVFDRLSMLCD